MYLNNYSYLDRSYPGGLALFPWHPSSGSLPRDVSRGQKCSTTIVSAHIRNSNLSEVTCIWTIGTLE